MSRASTPTSAERVLYPLGVLAVGVAAWMAFVAAFDVPQYLLPPPTAVARRIVGDPGLYLESTLHTLEKVVAGGAVGIAIGLALGMAVGLAPTLWRALSPYLVAARVLPTISIAPLLLVYLGVGFWTGVSFVALMVLFPMAVSTAAGMRRTPDDALDLMRSVNASRWQTVLLVRLRYAVPDIVAGLRQAATLAVVGAILAEWVVSTSGLGYLILISSENVRPDVMLASLVLVFAVGFSLYGLVSLVGNRFLRATRA